MTLLGKSQLPDEFDPRFYCKEYTEISGYDNLTARAHYNLYGIPEGRSGNAVKTRDDLIALIPKEASVLEIGPYFSPLMRGANVRYFDVLDREQMRLRAASQGEADANPPDIDYVSPNGDLTIVKDRFDFAISSYCIEHQPDLIKHLNDVEKLLRPGGCYFVLAPDKRYCHDHFMAESTIAGVIDAHHSKRSTHPLRAVIEHIGLSAHNDQFRHWQGDHGEPLENYAERTKTAIAAFEGANGAYVDVHSWYFTPSSMRTIMSALNALEYCNLKLIRCYETRKWHNDFWAILQRSGAS